MAVPSNLWGGIPGNADKGFTSRGRVLGRRRARRLSRCFAGVGVVIPAARLRELAAGATAAPSELVDVQFAFVAAETQREERRARVTRTKQRGLYWLIVAGLILTALNLLACAAYVFVSVVLHESPF